MIENEIWIILYNTQIFIYSTTEQGADTIIWLAISNNSSVTDPKISGDFFQDRVSVSKHLPLAWSRSSDEEENSLMTQLDTFYKRFQEY